MESRLESGSSNHHVTTWEFQHSNKELHTVYWDVVKENITIDEELKKIKENQMKETRDFPPMYDDIVADELAEEYAAYCTDFYDCSSDALASQVDESIFFEPEALTTSLTAMLHEGYSSFDDLLEISSQGNGYCPVTPTERTTPVLTISASPKRKRNNVNCVIVSPPLLDDDHTNDQCADDENIYGKEYVTGADGTYKEFQTIRAALREGKRNIPRRTTFLTPKQLKKKYKQSPQLKLKNVVSMLRQVRYVCGCSTDDKKVKRSHKAPILPDKSPSLSKSTAFYPRRDLVSEEFLLSRAQIFLAHIMGGKFISIPDLLKVVTSSVILKNRPLASFHDQLKHILSARKSDEVVGDIPQETSVLFPLMTNMGYPDTHRGVGQVNAASRIFSNLLSDLISPHIFKKIRFGTDISRQNIVINTKKDQLSSPFSWHTIGMQKLDYPEELSFNGLIRCQFNDVGMITSCTISYDCCTIIRSFFQKPSMHHMTSPPPGSMKLLAT